MIKFKCFNVGKIVIFQLIDYDLLMRHDVMLRFNRHDLFVRCHSKPDAYTFRGNSHNKYSGDNIYYIYLSYNALDLSPCYVEFVDEKEAELAVDTIVKAILLYMNATYFTTINEWEYIID